jgi:hypothetical protein
MKERKQQNDTIYSSTLNKTTHWKCVYMSPTFITEYISLVCSGKAALII